MKYISVIIFLVSLASWQFLSFFTYRGQEHSDIEVLFLLIGILSARDNFDARESIRKTWVQMINSSLQEKYLFVIGSDFCAIPPPNRISKYSCEEWNLTVPKDLTEATEFHTSKFDDTPGSVIATELTFETHHNIIIRRFCVLSNFIKVRLKIMLTDIASGENVLSATFTKTEDEDKPTTIICKSVEAFSFPANFEGKIVINDVITFDFQREECFMKIIDSSQIISYRISNNNLCIPFSFIYTVQDTSSLLQHLSEKQERFANWTYLQQVNNEKLMNESIAYNDILFVNVIDTYRNLSKKLLHFLTWSDTHFHFKYFLKTDDDTFINLKLIREKLKTESKPYHWWWSSFRKMWPIQKHGKWQEENYNSVTYPPFPCGAGYVLSSDLVQFIARNSDHLHCYQGEDVSIGIWLSPLNPYSVDSCWECENCVQEACNVPQLSVDQMYQTWNRFINFDQYMCENENK